MVKRGGNSRQARGSCLSNVVLRNRSHERATRRRYAPARSRPVAPIVRRLRTRFGKNGDTPDKSTKLFPRALHHHSFHSGRGATSSGRQKAAILDLKDGRHVKSISPNISACKLLRMSILVSKYTFSESRNALE